MKKSILLIIMVCFLSIVLVGCGKKEDDKKSADNTNDIVEKSGNSEDAVVEDLKLYSDNTKYVFEMGNTKYVFYYSGDTITGYHTYVDYNNASTAKFAYEALRLEDYQGLDKYYQKGRYIVFEWNKSSYEDMSASDFKTAYSYMKEITKK